MSGADGMDAVLENFGTDLTRADGSTIRAVLDRQYREVLKIAGEQIRATVSSAVGASLLYWETLTTALGERLSVISVRPASVGAMLVVLILGGCGLSEDTTFQPHGELVVCSNIHQTFIDSLEAQGEITQWIRFWDHPSPLVGVAVTVWSTRDGAIGDQPIALVRNVIVGVWDADTAALRDELVDWPGLLGWYGHNIDPTNELPFSGVLRFSESPFHGATVTRVDENGNPDPDGAFSAYSGIDDDIAGYELTALIQEIPDNWSGCVWSYLP